MRHDEYIFSTVSYIKIADTNLTANLLILQYYFYLYNIRIIYLMNIKLLQFF